ncbi:MAG: flagellar basal-body rod protein FlgF [Steroidobacteraceae bacterium]|jgi:flagellar basal-body rod protein FlgF|nr:flagellar basal-body rod protein FlgF [Steroidobacteraceae bacterium]
MDRILYVSMTGARQILEAQAVVSHNLANASTGGFRADLQAFASAAIAGDGFPTRVNVVGANSGFSHEAGPLTQTGRALDVAIDGAGWLAVQAPDGREAYTRAGNLRLTPEGALVTASGHPVLGDGGPIALPPAEQVAVGADGTITVVPQGTGPATAAAVARLKLVNPPADALVKGADGLVRRRDGADAPADAAVRVLSGAIEGSNVNAARALTEMIEYSRLFDMQVKLMGQADQNGQAAQRLLAAG